MSADGGDDVESELDAFFATYRAAYAARDVGAIREHYGVPLLSVTPDDLVWMETGEAVEKVMAAYLDTLPDDFDRGEIDELVYHLLTDDAVVASSAWTRYTADGEVFEELGTTYLLHRGDDGWRIVALVLHDPGAVIG